MNDYRAISCAAYDEIEILAMHRSFVQVNWLDEDGQSRACKGHLIDTAIHDRAEYLVIESNEQRQQIRLDKVTTITDAQAALLWSAAGI